MRTFIDGTGADSTAAVAALTPAQRRALIPVDLYVINTAPNFAGQYLGKQFLLTDHASPLVWSYIGKFVTATISRSEVASKIGLDSDTLTVTWSPKDTDTLADDGSGPPPVTLLTALQGFTYGVFDNGSLEVWRCLMPTRGDCDTYGATLLFSGRIGDLIPNRLSIDISVVDRRETLNTQVPTNIIEPTNIFAQYATGMIPSGAPTSFAVVSGSTVAKVYADASPTMPADTYDAGYILFTSGHLSGMYKAVRVQTVESGHHAFYLRDPLPFVPQVGDTLGAFAPIPRDYAGAIAAGVETDAFPFVPSPLNSSVVIS